MRPVRDRWHAVQELSRRGIVGPRTVMTDGITVYPLERIGNQLFQYAAGLAQARRLGCPLYVAQGFFRGPGSQRPWTDYSLDAFDTGLIVPEEETAHRPVLRGLPVMMVPLAFQKAVGHRFRKPIGKLFTEASFTYDPRIEHITVPTTLLGHFQSWRYFESVADEVRERMFRLTSPSEWYRQTSRQIVPGDGSVILNVRRGDFLLPHVKAYHGLTQRPFYERALDLIRRLGTDGTVYLMTDATEDVLAELHGIADLVPLRPPAGVSPMESIAVLARADAVAIANSSFSWWGAWLGGRPGQTVIAPRPWLTTSTIDTRDLLPPGWLTIDREY